MYSLNAFGNRDARQVYSRREPSQACAEPSTPQNTLRSTVVLHAPQRIKCSTTVVNRWISYTYSRQSYCCCPTTVVLLYHRSIFPKKKQSIHKRHSKTRITPTHVSCHRKNKMHVSHTHTTKPYAWDQSYTRGMFVFFFSSFPPPHYYRTILLLYSVRLILLYIPPPKKI